MFDDFALVLREQPARLDHHLHALVGIALLGLLMVGCDRAEEPVSGPQYSDSPSAEVKPDYHLAIHPLHNPETLAFAYQPLIDYLNSHLEDVHFSLEASRNYQAYEAKFRAREPAFLLPNPWQTLEAIKVGYHVIAMAGDAEDFKGIFIIRKDSKIEAPADLEGKVVSYPSHTALAACIMPQYYLFQQGIDVDKDIENRFVGSQESSIMNAYLGEAAVGVTWPPPWRLFQRDHPKKAAELKVVWETPSLMNNSVMARDDVLPRVRDQVQALIINLDKTPEGQSVLAAMETARFYPANDASYDKVRDYVANFERDVRPVERR